MDTMSSLPQDLFQNILAYLRPAEILNSTVLTNTLCRDFSDDPMVWQMQMKTAIQQGVLRLTPDSGYQKSEILRVLNARATIEFTQGCMEGKHRFFDSVYNLPTSLAEEASKHNVHPMGTRSIFSVDNRCYEVTEFLNNHPGGKEKLLLYDGKDASSAFDVFGHSKAAHDYMRRRLLVIDAVDFVGRTGRPSFDAVRQGMKGSRPMWFDEPWHLSREVGNRGSNRKSSVKKFLFLDFHLVFYLVILLIGSSFASGHRFQMRFVS